MDMNNTRAREVLAIIPARGGSKGLPGKNVMDLCGKPLIAWTIEAALGAASVHRVVVSTDDEEIAAVAREHGAEVPFMRPSELARDDTLGIAPVLHCLDWLDRNEGYGPDITIMLQATSPLRTCAYIDGMLEQFISGELDAMVSFTQVTEPPQWMKRIGSDGRMITLLSEDQVERPRQAYDNLYIPNGAIYAARTGYLLERGSFFTPETRPFIMPVMDSVDIDEQFDFMVAECVLRQRLERKDVG